MQSHIGNDAYLSANFPLHFACKYGCSENVLALVQREANLSIIEDSLGWIPAHYAAAYGKLDCLQKVLMVMNAPESVNLQSTKLKCTLAHCAAENGQIDCLQWLLQVGANPNIKDIVGETALHKACRAGHVNCVYVLLEFRCDIKIVNHSGELANTLAEKNGHAMLSCFIHGMEGCSSLNWHEALREGYHQMTSGQYNTRSFECINPLDAQCNRKRCRESVDSFTVKRPRVEDAVLAVPSENLNRQLQYLLPPFTTSVVEHEKLCRMERGYNSKLMQSMFNEFYGC